MKHATTALLALTSGTLVVAFLWMPSARTAPNNPAEDVSGDDAVLSASGGAASESAAVEPAAPAVNTAACQPACGYEAAKRFDAAFAWYRDNVATCGFDVLHNDGSKDKEGFEGSVASFTTPCGLPIAVKRRRVENERHSEVVAECEVIQSLLPAAEACDECLPKYIATLEAPTANASAPPAHVCVMSRIPGATSANRLFSPTHSLLKSVPAEQSFALARNVTIQAFAIVRQLNRMHVLHTDFKSGNMLLTNRSQPGQVPYYKLTLVDFGYVVRSTLHKWRDTWSKCQDGLHKTLQEWTTGERYVDRFGPDKQNNWRGPCLENGWGMARALVKLFFPGGSGHTVKPEWVKHDHSVLWTLYQVQHPDFSKRLRDMDRVLKYLRAAKQWA